jgi:ubiquinone biosynthesis protein COQ4
MAGKIAVVGLSYGDGTSVMRYSPLVRAQSNMSRIIRRLTSNVYRALSRGFTAARLFVLMILDVKRQVYYGVLFVISTEGNSIERCLAAFRATPCGRDLLQRRPSSWTLLTNRPLLESCPTGSLGHSYAEFTSAYRLDERYYHGMAIENGERESGAERAWFRTRVEASHDLRHMIAGYEPDMLGEICLLSFRVGQIRHIGMLLLTVLGTVNLLLRSQDPVIGPVLEAYRRGRRTLLLDLLPWEDGLALPLSAHRASLGLTPTNCYPRPVMPEAYGAERVILLETPPQQESAGVRP